MINTATFLCDDFERLQNHLFQNKDEQAAIILARQSVSENETRLLIREVISISKEFIIYQSGENITYDYEAFFTVIKKAQKDGLSIIIAHSHFEGYSHFSPQDDKTEMPILRSLYMRTQGPHGSIVFCDNGEFQGRIFDTAKNEYVPINKIRVLGTQYRIINAVDSQAIAFDKDVYSRNILAFGEDMQRILANLNIGVVGCGGTGSCLIEQLCRMGTGKITICDFDTFEKSNITRMHGSSLSDVGKSKVKVMEDMISSLGLGTNVIAIDEKLTPTTAIALKDCDVIFSCIDNSDFTRSILNRLSIFYLIPLIDMGIKFYSQNGRLKEIYGRIDVVLPESGCLDCRDVISSKRISAELMKSEEHKRLLAEGYAAEIENDKVQTIVFNTLIASYAVDELVRMLTGYRVSQAPETMYYFMRGKVSPTKTDPAPSCLCQKHNGFVGIGDTLPFLNINW